MKLNKRLLIVTIVGLALAITPMAARLGGAGSSAAFLSMGGGARPIAMGCAYTALAEGPDALFWNPAGIATAASPQASFGQAILFAGMLEENLAGAFPLDQSSALGVQVLAHLSGQIEITTYDQPQGTGRYYSANNYAVGVTYARQMTDKFSAGFTVKLIDLTLDQVSAVGIAFDAGATYRIDFNNLRLGFAIQNFGPDMRYDGSPLDFLTHKDTLQTDDIPSSYLSEPFRLPFTFAGGAAIDLVEPDSVGSGSRLTLAADFFHLSDQSAKGALGLEYGLNDMFFLRFGFGINTAPELSSDTADSTAPPIDAATILREVLSNRNDRGPSAGLGVKIPLGDYKLAVDYSFEWHWYLTPVHRASIGINF